MAADEMSRQDSSLGRMVQYKVNGATVYSDSRSITIAPNLTADLLKAAPGTDVTVSVTKGTQAFKSAIQNFANAYNDTVNEIDKDTDRAELLREARWRNPLVRRCAMPSFRPYLETILGPYLPQALT